MAVGVLSGNRNFEGRIHPFTRANYLASPPLVIAYALAGTVDIDFEKDPLGKEMKLFLGSDKISLNILWLLQVWTLITTILIMCCFRCHKRW